jgi:hypothetical protein
MSQGAAEDWHRARGKESNVHHFRGAHLEHGRAPARRTPARRPDLTALSAAEIRELQAIEAAMRPTPGDPVGEAALTPQQVARVRALAAKAWGATGGAPVVGLEPDAALSARSDNSGHRSGASRASDAYQRDESAS